MSAITHVHQRCMYALLLRGVSCTCVCLCLILWNSASGGMGFRNPPDVECVNCGIILTFAPLANTRGRKNRGEERRKEMRGGEGEERERGRFEIDAHF